MDRRRRTRPVSSPVASVTEPLESRRLMAAVADRFEPNDSFEAATNLGTLGDRTENDLSIHAANNNDYFRFTAAASGAMSIRFNFDQSQGDIDVFLQDSDRLLLDSSATTASPERLDWNVVAGQTYFIKVIGFGGATQADYDMIIDGPAALSPEPGDQPSESIALSVGSTVTQSIQNSTDVDVWKITAAAGQTLRFDVDQRGSAFDSYLRLFNSSGTQLAANNDANAPGETAATPRESYISHTFSSAGTYYIVVSGNPNRSYNLITGGGDVTGSQGAYALTVTAGTTQPPPPPPTGDTDDQISEARSISVGGNVSDTISTPTDVDMFKFTVRAGQRIGFDVDLPSGSTLDSFVKVWKASGSRYTSNDNGTAPGETSAGKASYVEYTFTAAGTVYVSVSGYPNSGFNGVTGAGDVAGSTGAYRLFIVDRTPAAATASAGAVAPFSAKPVTGPALLSDRDALLGRAAARLV